MTRRPVSAELAPPRGLADPHAQTVWATGFRFPPRLALRGEAWETPDGDVVDVDFLGDKPGAPGVLVLHGLEGSSQAVYVRGLLAAIDAKGWNGAALNFRSCGPSPHRLARTYHSGFTDDLQLAATRLKAKWGTLAVAGFSLGGNVTLKWLGEQGANAAADAGVGISVPFDLGAAAHAIDSPGFWGFVYRERFLRSLRAKALRTCAAHPGLLEPDEVRRAKSFAAFDDIVTARLNGFASAADYWARCSSSGFLDRIRVPTLMVSADDDPIVPGATIPREAIANPAIDMRITAHGGHVGFVGGSVMRPRYVAEEWAIAFLERRFAALAAPALRREGA